MNFVFENFEDDDILAAVLAFMLLKKSKRKATKTKLMGRH